MQRTQKHIILSWVFQIERERESKILGWYGVVVAVVDIVWPVLVVVVVVVVVLVVVVVVLMTIVAVMLAGRQVKRRCESMSL